MAIWSLGFRVRSTTGPGILHVYELQAVPGCSVRLIEVGIPNANTGLMELKVYPRTDPQSLTEAAQRFPFTQEEDESEWDEKSPVQCLVPLNDGHAVAWRRDSPLIANHRRKQHAFGYLGVVWAMRPGIVINEKVSVVLQTGGNLTESDVWFVVEA